MGKFPIKLAIGELSWWINILVGKYPSTKCELIEVFRAEMQNVKLVLKLHQVFEQKTCIAHQNPVYLHSSGINVKLQYIN